MRHQATYLGRFGEAANLARAARTGIQGVATLPEVLLAVAKASQGAMLLGDFMQLGPGGVPFPTLGGGHRGSR